MKRTSTSAEKRHMQKVAEMGCIVCELAGFKDTPSEVHHVRARHGWGRSSHLATIPLCPIHHRGKHGVHSMGRDEFEAMHGYSEFRLLEIVQEKMGV